ncbi:MAG TPA: DUF3093 domain-containing protein [Sporichthyaceae bacterium]
MHNVEHYRERLRVPHRWWLPPVFFLVVLPLGVAQYVGTVAGVVALALLLTFVVWLLLSYGAVDLVIDDTRFRAGPECVELRRLGAVSPLDAEQARLLRGVRADARAPLVLRGYLPLAVRVDVQDPQQPVPYWYVSTRQPHALAAALRAARDRAVG